MLPVAALLAGCGAGAQDESNTAAAEPAAIEMTVGEGDAATRYQVTIDSLADDGTFLTLNGAARCTGRAGGRGCSLFSDFAGYRANWDFSGIRLLDRRTQTGYQPVTDHDDSVVRRTFWASSMSDMAGTEMEPGETQRFWVRYAAPPAGTRHLDVLFPGGGPVVLDQAVTRGGVDTSPLPAGWLPDGTSPLDRPLDSPSTAGLNLNRGQVTAQVTSKGARTVQREGRRTVTLAADVLFDFDDATLAPDAERELRAVAADARAHAQGPIAVDGYTDAKGAEDYNLRLSRERAQAVADRLAAELPGTPLEVVGHGERDPVAANTRNGADHPAGRAKNRRVEVRYALRAPADDAAAPEEPEPAPEAAAELEPVEWTTDQANTRLRAQVHPVQRLGSMAIARVDVTCVASDQPNCGGGAVFSSHDARIVLDQGGGNLRYASELLLRDPASGSTFTPAYGSDGTQLTTETALSVGRTTPIWAYYVAPPPTVDALTVKLPAGGPAVSGVPVR